MQIFAGVLRWLRLLWRGRQTISGVVDDGYFWRFRWLRLRKRQRYGKQILYDDMLPLSTGKWLQHEWPWMTLSGYFMTKCVFGQHFLNQSVWISKIVQPLRFCGVLCIARSVSQPR